MRLNTRCPKTNCRHDSVIGMMEPWCHSSVETRHISWYNLDFGWWPGMGWDGGGGCYVGKWLEMVAQLWRLALPPHHHHIVMGSQMLGASFALIIFRATVSFLHWYCASLVFLEASPCRAFDPRAPTPSIRFYTDHIVYNSTQNIRAQQTSLRKCEHMLHIAFNVIIYAFASCSVCDALIVFIGHVG